MCWLLYGQAKPNGADQRHVSQVLQSVCTRCLDSCGRWRAQHANNTFNCWHWQLYSLPRRSCSVTVYLLKEATLQTSLLHSQYLLKSHIFGVRKSHHFNFPWYSLYLKTNVHRLFKMDHCVTQYEWAPPIPWCRVKTLRSSHLQEATLHISTSLVRFPLLSVKLSQSSSCKVSPKLAMHLIVPRK